MVVAPKLQLRFSSILPPSSVPKLSLLNKMIKSQGFGNQSSVNKIHVKQSYVLMTWMSYTQSSSSGLKLPTIFSYPSRTKTFTQIKSPMAHKTFSQQQFKFKFFFMSASFSILGGYYDSSYQLSSVNSTLYFLLNFKSENNVSGSNLFLLKRLSLSIQSSETLFFDFNRFYLS